MYRMSVELDPSLIPAHTLLYEYTDSQGISFENKHLYFQPVAEVMVKITCVVAIVMCDASGHTRGSSEYILRFKDPGTMIS
jgi:hypothetical protein